MLGKPGVTTVGLRLVAVFEAAKGVIVLAVGMGALSLFHRDVAHAAAGIVKQLKLDPAYEVTQKFLDIAGTVTDTTLILTAFVAVIYALMRFAEAYGLWYAKAWAEWFAVLTGGIYLLVEIYELMERVTPIRVGLFVANIAVVIYLARVLVRNRRLRAQSR